MGRKEKIDFIEMLKKRTKKASIEVIFLTREFERIKDLQVITYQIVKSSTSVAANYRAASRAISDKALYAKMKIVEEEADETVFWLEILEEVEPRQIKKIKLLKNEYEEFVKIISKTNATLRRKLNR